MGSFEAQEEPTPSPPPPPPLKRHKGLSAEKKTQKNCGLKEGISDIFSSRVRRDAEYGFQFPHIPLWRNHVAILDFAESAIWSTQVMSRRCLVRNRNLVGEILRFRRVVESDLKTRRCYSFIWGKEPSFTDLSEHRSARTAVLKAIAATVFRWLEVQKIKNGSAIPVGWIPWQFLENSGDSGLLHLPSESRLWIQCLQMTGDLGSQKPPCANDVSEDSWIDFRTF